MSLLQLLTGADAPVMKPRARMEALLDRPDTAEAVQALDPVQFYDLYHDVGPSDAAVLLEYASPEQFQTCLDLDIWRGDVMDDAEMTPWVEQMLALPDEKFAEFWRETDPEILGLYLHRNVHLYISEDRNDEVDIPEGESPNVAQSPDFNYWIAYPEDTDRAEVLRQLVDRMYAVLGVEKAWSVLAAMNFEMESDLEESAYRFRTARIREFGFMPRDEAAAVFATVDVAKEADRIRHETSAELYVEPYPYSEKVENALAALDATPAGDCYLGKILAELANRDAVRYQLVSTAQQIATYDGYRPHEEQGWQEGMTLAVAYVNLGLEYASERDDGAARRILSHVSLRRLCALGYSLTMELQRKAKLLVSRGHLSIIKDKPLSLLMDSQRDAVEGMLCERPRPLASAMTPFVSLQDIHAAAAVIADVATRELFFGEALHKTWEDIAKVAYMHDLVLGIENVHFDNVAITFLTRRYLRLGEAWSVFYDDELPTREDVVAAIAPEEIRAMFASTLDHVSASALARFSLQMRELVDSVWPASAQKPDPRFMNALVVATKDA